jgi:hypothetical protein
MDHTVGIMMHATAVALMTAMPSSLLAGLLVAYDLPALHTQHV